jgi:hypothetical protein
MVISDHKVTGDELRNSMPLRRMRTALAGRENLAWALRENAPDVSSLLALICSIFLSYSSIPHGVVNG